jgi:CubicO group peptidase (beta-lactamase class C family)
MLRNSFSIAAHLHTAGADPSAVSPGPPQPNRSPRAPPMRQSTLTSTANAAAEHPGVSLAIVEGDRSCTLRGFGQARPDGEAPSLKHLSSLVSLTKSFTALAVMQLVEAKMIEPDAPVQHYLPWFRVADPQALCPDNRASPVEPDRRPVHGIRRIPWPISTTARALPSARHVRYPRSSSAIRSTRSSNIATRITTCSG